MNQDKLLTSLVMVALVAGAMVPVIGVAQPGGLEDSIANDNMTSQFRDYHLQPMAREPLVEDAEDGQVTLTLVTGETTTETFELLVYEIEREINIVDAESGEEIPLGFELHSYRGSVLGQSDSRAFINVLGYGVSGYIQTADHYILFEPLAALQPEAPEEVAVVYEPKDMIPSLSGPLETVEHEVETTSDESDGGTVAADSTDHLHTAVDSEFRAQYGSNWKSKAIDINDRIDDNFEKSLSWSLDVSSIHIESCSSDSCDQNHGMGPADCDDLWSDFRTHSENDHSGHDLRIHLTGRVLSGCVGIADLDGKYSIVQIEDSGSKYDGRTNLYEAEIVGSQEIGHNYDAEHEMGRNREHDHGHWHTHEHCHGIEVFGQCLTGYEEHSHWHEDIWDHATIMRAGYPHWNEDWAEEEWIDEFTLSSETTMSNCRNAASCGP